MDELTLMLKALLELSYWGNLKTKTFAKVVKIKFIWQKLI